MARTTLHLLVSLFLLCIVYSAQATVVYVPDNYTTIQGAINAVSNGDTVVVRSGTYFENINFRGKAITVTSEQGPNVTTIDGGSPSNTDSASVVVFSSGEDSSSVLDGLTLANGDGTREHSSTYGGGIYCELSDPTITNNIVTDNNALYGGGIYCRDASPTISSNTITENSVGFTGGGIYCTESSPTIVDNMITDNVYGGGIHMSNSSPLIANNTITGNSCGRQGGGIMCSSSSPTIRNNTIMTNRADGGGGIYCSTGSPTLSNNIIADNSANETSSSQGGGGGIFFSDMDSLPTVSNNLVEGNWAEWGGGGIRCRNSTVSMTNTILWNNSSPVGAEMILGDSSNTAISYSDVYAGQDSIDVEAGSILSWGTGMVDADPLFADPEYHLQSTSPCIDTGDPAILDACRPPGEGEDRSDMGAHGGAENCGWPDDAIELNIDPTGPTSVANGDTLFFRTYVQNNTGSMVAGDYWLSVLLPNSNEIQIPGAFLNLTNPLSGQVPGLDSINFNNELYVPMFASAGAYRIIGRVGIHPSNSIDEWWLDFEVTE